MPPKQLCKTALIIDSRLGKLLARLTDDELGSLVRRAMTSIMSGTASTFDPYLSIDICLTEKRAGWSLAIIEPP
jgi:hypothetical protein